MRKIKNRNKIPFFLFVMIHVCAFSQQLDSINLLKIKNESISSLDKQFIKYKAMSDSIWSYAELGFLEYKSTKILQDTLKKEGFTLSSNIAGMPTAFMAKYGNGKPVIGLLAEFDALPGMSQLVKPIKQADTKRVNGHGCGHNLFGVASVAAAIEIKEQIKQGSFNGSVVVFGTPAEEGGSGKVYLTREGFFNDVDIVMHWHPSNQNILSCNSLANITAKFRFYGFSTHASASPDKGISALDAVESMDYMANLLREHLPEKTRMHYVITSGGEAPNIVPDFAEVYYYVRHPNMDEVKKIFDKLVNIAKGAALGTGTEMDYEIIGGVYNILPVERLSRIMYENLMFVGGISLNDDEILFAKEMQKSLNVKNPPPLTVFKDFPPFEVLYNKKGRASTDVGDVSWNVPTAGFKVASFVPGIESHSWQRVACSGSSIGAKGMMVAAKALTLTAIDLLNNSEEIVAIHEEWRKNKGDDFIYSPLLGDRKPALNYRLK